MNRMAVIKIAEWLFIRFNVRLELRAIPNSLRIHSLAEIPISPPQRNLSCSPRFCAVEAFEINISPPPLSTLMPHLRIAFTIVKSFPRTLRAPFMLRRNISAGKYFSFISFESVAWDTSLLLTGASS